LNLNRNTEPIIPRLRTNHPREGGVQVCSIEVEHSYSRGNDSKNDDKTMILKKSLEAAVQYQSYLAHFILGAGIQI
jgi:hypothetical protein